ncbi:hypothetical protein ACH46L_03535 [Streptomyces althioticus]|uniref:hypothetical protein n=1 Tax=Streptomyces althioticus TaxID=83380 RepID=UPI0037BDC3F7
MATGWKIRPIRLPDEHLPTGTRETDWRCRTCATPWPCQTAGEFLGRGRCTCGATTWRENRGPRNWHVGPRCYTAADRVVAEAADLKAYREAHPHYPPSHYYPPKPRRARRQKPPYRHRPTGPGDIRPGTWTWVKPGALHPGWGDIHHHAMVTRPGLPWTEVWLTLDGTVHEVKADQLILIGGPRSKDRPAWWNWTVAAHLAHDQPASEPTPDTTAVQLDLLSGLTGV